MQEEIEHKTVNLAISTTKLSARTVLRAVKAAFRLYQSKTSQGKQNTALSIWSNPTVTCTGQKPALGSSQDNMGNLPA